MRAHDERTLNFVTRILIALAAVAAGLTLSAAPLSQQALIVLAEGHLSFGPVAIDMTLPQAEAALRQPLSLRPNESDVCAGENATMSIQGRRVTLTFSGEGSERKLAAILVPLDAPAHLDEILQGLRRRIPRLVPSPAQQDESARATKPLLELNGDASQLVLISPAEKWMLLSRGCVN